MTDHPAEQAPSSRVLDYQSPPPPVSGDLMRFFVGVGPWWILPSWKSVVLLLILAGTILALRCRPPARKPGITHMTIVGSPGFNSVFLPMPIHDAVFCIDGNGCPNLW